MADGIALVDPDQIDRNPENPRLIFRLEDLEPLEDSIKHQGILVPLTVYRDGKRYVVLDGERRWRCAIKLGLPLVPVVSQPKPDRLTNLMMMFAIHNQRRDWDPLPTAYKLRDLEKEFEGENGRKPNERELAEIASVNVGEVRRLKNILGLPEEYHQELMEELEKPRSKQRLTVDHVLESTRGSKALRKQEVLAGDEEWGLTRALVDKFKAGYLTSTVEPRLLAKIARAVDRGEVTAKTARKVTLRLIAESEYTIKDAFEDSVAAVDLAHGSSQLADRLATRLGEQLERNFSATTNLEGSLQELRAIIDRVLGN